MSTPTIQSHKSYFDFSVEMTQNNWAATLVCNSHRSGRPSLSGNNHAKIIIEGVKESGEYFRKKVHFLGPTSTEETLPVPFRGSKCFMSWQRIGRVEIEDRTHKPAEHHTHKSPTWLRSSEKIQELMCQAELERDNPSEFPRPFSIFGNKSILTSDLDTFKITNPLVAAIANCNKTLFKWLYRTAKETLKKHPIDKSNQYPNIFDNPNFIPWGGVLWGENGVDLIDVAIKELEYKCAYTQWHTYSNDYEGEDEVKKSVTWKDALSEYSIRVVRNALKNAFTKEERHRVIQNITKIFRQHDLQGRIPRKSRLLGILRFKDLSGVSYGAEFAHKITEKIEKKNEEHKRLIKKYFDKSPIVLTDKDGAISRNFSQEIIKESGGDYLVLYRRILKLIAEHTNLIPLTPDSCFTWAREKLTIIDVEIPDVGIEFFISPTKRYLTPVKKGVVITL